MTTVYLNKIEAVKDLREKTGCGLIIASEAYNYAEGDKKVAMAYVRASGLAVATPGLTFDQRVESFMRREDEGR